MDYPINQPSTNFTWAEAEVTQHRNINNSIPSELWPTIINTAQRMEAVRSFLESRHISINSWYRCRELNIAIGSNPNTTQHRLGEAVDFICPAFGNPLKICQKLLKYLPVLKYDQLIYEHSWVHISFPSNPSAKNKGQTLTLLSSGKYAVGITDKFGNAI